MEHQFFIRQQNLKLYRSLMAASDDDGARRIFRCALGVFGSARWVRAESSARHQKCLARADGPTVEGCEKISINHLRKITTWRAQPRKGNRHPDKYRVFRANAV